ncbi:hypothetical protein AB1N83_011785 [Pleurotus pulmonarius]
MGDIGTARYHRRANADSVAVYAVDSASSCQISTPKATRSWFFTPFLSNHSATVSQSAKRRKSGPYTTDCGTEPSYHAYEHRSQRLDCCQSPSMSAFRGKVFVGMSTKASNG